MEPGKILVAEQQGAHVVKLLGDVRLNLCSALDDYFERIFSDEGFLSVIVDLSEADNLDSTALGTLARLGVTAKQEHGFTPVILCTNPDISRILETMGFDQLFQVRDSHLRSDKELEQLPQVACCENEMRDKVLAAHKTLMGLNEHNRAAFSELVCSLESGRN